jgi:hypothetical protein
MRRRSALSVVVVATLVALTGVLAARHGRAKPAGRVWFVAPDGSPANAGDQEHPLDLKTALSGKTRISPGDTVWLRGGTYRGVFVSQLTGTEDAPIVVRQFPGERATIDSAPSLEPALYVWGAWTTYWGFEITSSNQDRPSTSTGPQFDHLTRGSGVESRAPNTKFVNLIVHDLTIGIGIWSDAENAEAYGNIVYYNGFHADDRGHGHGIYTQNLRGERRLTDNILFSQFSHGIHAYGTSQASLNNIRLEGNISFNNGVLERYYAPNILIGGGRPAQDPVVLRNYTYLTSGLRQGGGNNIGYNAGCTNLLARENYFAGSIPLGLNGACGGSISKNVFYGTRDARMADQYPDNTYLTERPSGTQVFVRPNRYEPGRANIAVYNWDRWRTVSVDLSAAGLSRGTRFEIRDVENFFGPPVVSGSYTGHPVTLPMRGLTAVTPPVGGLEIPPHTAPEFGAFVVLPQSR